MNKAVLSCRHRSRHTHFGTVGTSDAASWLHLDTTGLWTWCAVGGIWGKYWMFFDGLPDLGLARALKDYDPLTPEELEGRWIGILLRPGDLL
jgi:hypothetical protein